MKWYTLEEQRPEHDSYVLLALKDGTFTGASYYSYNGKDTARYGFESLQRQGFWQTHVGCCKAGLCCDDDSYMYNEDDIRYWTNWNELKATFPDTKIWKWDPIKEKWL